MVICKYFIQGNCRFGNKCRFEHAERGYDPPSHYSGRNESQHYRTSQFDNSTFRQSSNVEDVIQLVINEVSSLLQNEKCGQWPLSCFAPIKDRGCYPGIDDYSPEEIRWLTYKALKSGNVEHCKRRIQELFSRHKIEKTNLMTCNRDTFSVIKKLLSGPIPQNTSSFKMPINSAQSAASSMPSFSFNLAQHGLQPKENLFGSSSQQFVQPNSNVPSLFGCINNNNNNNTTSQQPPANFHNLQTSVFGNNTNTAEELTPEKIYSSKTNGSSMNVFGDNKLNVFPQQTVQQTSVTGVNFGLQQQQQENYQDSGIYTPLEDLTDVDINMFKLQTFSTGQVPTKPPSRDLSNR